MEKRKLGLDPLPPPQIPPYLEREEQGEPFVTPTAITKNTYEY